MRGKSMKVSRERGKERQINEGKRLREGSDRDGRSRGRREGGGGDGKG